MGDRAQETRRDGPAQRDPYRLEPRERVGLLEAERADIHEDEVRLDGIEIDRYAALLPPLAEPPGARMVVGEALDVVVEGVEARRGDDSGLAHRAAETVLLDPRLRHQRGRARDDRTERAAEPFGETERDGVEEPPHLRRGDTERNGRIREPRPVEMHTEAELPRGLHDCAQPVERPNRASGAVVRVLDRDHGCARDVEPVGDARRDSHLVGREPAANSRQPARLQPRMHRRPAELGHHDVRRLLDDQLGPARAEDRERDLIRHRRGRKVHRLLLAEERGGTPLELEDGRILAALLVSHLRPRDRGAHAVGRLCLGVGTKIDHASRLRDRATLEG